MARSSAMSTGATSANSTAACPCSSCRPMRRRCVMASGELVVGRLGAGPPPLARVPVSRSLELVDDGLEGVLDVVADRHEQLDDDGEEQREDDPVLGHCLAFLALCVVLDPIDEK